MSWKPSLSWLVLGACALAQPASASDTNGQMVFAGKTRSYAIHSPDRAPPPGGFPVILAFHGGGMQGQGMRRLTHLDTIADEKGVIVIYPDGLDRHWNDGRSTIKNPQDDVGFVAALLDQVGHSYSIDSRRIYATGISNGALFAQRLGCDLSGRIAGIAPVAGTMPTDIASRCRQGRPVAVLQIGGTADPIMPFKGGTVATPGGAGEGGQVLSLAETASLWLRRNGCGLQGTAFQLPPVAPLDRTRVLGMTYDSCPAKSSVKVLTIMGGGHTWPGGPQYAPPRFIGQASRQIDASAVIVDFFLALPPR